MNDTFNNWNSGVWTNNDNSFIDFSVLKAKLSLVVEDQKICANNFNADIISAYNSFFTTFSQSIASSIGGIISKTHLLTFLTIFKIIAL